MNNDSTKVVVRMAPSPTGLMHVGNTRTALFDYLFAKQHGGKYILRIEDTDKERSKKEYEEDILENFKWLGIVHDELYRQSERTDIYKKYLNDLVASGMAYVSKETPKEEGQRAEVIRFKNPNKKVTFTDLIRGEITFDTTDLGDFVIAKSLEEPLYHLAVVVDDHDMGVTHIIRGEDHISNTPRQILIQEAIGASRPLYAHLPLILAADRSKLSKRKHGESVSTTFYRQQGYSPDAMKNFMALLGWNPGTDQEMFSLDDLVKTFDLSKVQKSGAIFNVEKLNWLNKEYIKKLPVDVLKKEIQTRIAPLTLDDEILSRALLVITEKIEKLGDIETLFKAGEFEYLFTEPTYQPTQLLWKGEGDFSIIKEHLIAIQGLLQALSGPFTAATVKEAIWPYAEEKGRGVVLWPMRFALSGKDKSPDPFVLSELLGKEKTLARLAHAQKNIT